MLGTANRRGETLLMAASYHGRLDWVELLLKEPVVRSSINARDEFGVTALMHAVVQGHVDMVRKLLKVEGVHLYYRDIASKRNALELTDVLREEEEDKALEVREVLGTVWKEEEELYEVVYR